MLDNANLTATAWDGDKLIGVARSSTDFAFYCYLSDLAVDESYQRSGIGKMLITITCIAEGGGGFPHPALRACCLVQGDT